MAPTSWKIYLLATFLSLILLLQVSVATITNTPHLNGPALPVLPSSLPWGKETPGDFQHPGLWHSHDDLERMRINVLAGNNPWKSAFDQFSTNMFSLANYTMQGPKQVLVRGTGSNYTTFTHDVRAAWQNAIMCKISSSDFVHNGTDSHWGQGYITREQAHWDRSTTILDAWGSNLTDITGTDASLLIGLEGDMFANAAEIMRWEGNWVEAGSKWQGGSGFSIQLYWLFARQSIINGQANYGMVSIKALLSFAVYLDDVVLYNYALYLMLNDHCAGIYGNYDSRSGQPLEAGRDQAHVMSGLAWTAEGARVIRNQGGDLFGLDNNLLLRAAEYTAKYNLNNTVPYNPKVFRCEAVLVGGPWTEIAVVNRGLGVYAWDILYYEYVAARNISAPWMSKAKNTLGFESIPSSSMDDLPGWGDLIWAY